MNPSHSKDNSDSSRPISNGVDLAQKRCVPCEAGAAPLTKEEAERLMGQLPHWKLSSDAKSIYKVFKFKNWLQAVDFTNKISAIAEKEGHHPDIDLHWGRVGVTLTTHAIGGLSENDFILAAKIDTIA